jgi:drug/metabolite transporter (DMT)-like permease
LAFGGSGYALYAIALLVSEHSTKVGAFNIVAGAILGVCAGLLWTAQGTIMISYPQENEKGRYFAWFWAIFNLGGVIGSLVSFDRTNFQRPCKADYQEHTNWAADSFRPKLQCACVEQDGW